MPQSARLHRLLVRPALALCALLLVGGGPTDASGPSVRAGDVRAGDESNRLRVIIRSTLEGVPDTCGDDDTMRVVVLDGGREVATHDYCSAYNLGSARLVTDRRGRHFVLLEHGEGRGTRATRMFLTVFEFTDYFDRRAQLLVSQPVAIGANSIYSYEVDAPVGGGIILSGTWDVDEGALAPWEFKNVPDRSRTVLEIDTLRTGQ